MCSTDPLVVLRCGISVPAAAYVLLLDLEARDIEVWREGDQLILEPAERLTPDDDRAIRVLKPFLLTLLSYSVSGPADVLHFDDRPRQTAHA